MARTEAILCFGGLRRHAALDLRRLSLEAVSQIPQIAVTTAPVRHFAAERRPIAECLRSLHQKGLLLTVG